MRIILRASALVIAAALVIAVFAACGCTSRRENEEKKYEVKDFHSEVENADYNNPEVDVAIGDFESMSDFIEGFQNGDFDGKVISITGINKRYGDTCSIVQQKDNGSSIGVTWEILDGDFPDDYPADGQKITVRGVVEITTEEGYRAIEVPKDNIITEK